MFNWFKKKEEVKEEMPTEIVAVLYVCTMDSMRPWRSWVTTDLNNPWDKFISWYTEDDSKYFVIEDKDSADKDVIMRDTISRVEIRQEKRVVTGKDK